MLDLGGPPTTGFLVWRLAMRWRSAVDRAVAPLGLTHAQYALLGSLFGVARAGERPTQRQLADHTGLDAIYVSKLARALEAGGLVERVTDPDDARAVRLGLTARGTAVAAEAVDLVARLHDEVTAPLGGTGSERTRAFAETLQTLLAAPLPTPTTTGDTP
ncbi:MAG TPA: MarR family transcriptional regulator [Acidimicrobiales bacterium]|nr:MarR family transcriptional regulator [Acidimicrobiales bacterium]